MILNKKAMKLSVTELLLLAVSVFWLIGLRTIFPVCTPSESGYMACHWAGETLKGISVLMTVLCVLHMLLPDLKLGMGIDFSMIGIAVLAYFVPGTVISICAMEGMACHTTRLWTLAFAAGTVVLALADCILAVSVLAQEKHKRPEARKSL